MERRLNSVNAWYRWLAGALLLSFLMTSLQAAEPSDSWKRASPDVPITLPADEFAHPDYKTEWWYFTGNLWDQKTSRRFGYQLTFFRIGVRPPAERSSVSSEFVVDHFWFAHFAISDPQRGKFYVAERISRGAFAEAGSGPLADDSRVAWLKDWEMRRTSDEAGHYELVASADDFSLKLLLDTSKPRVLQGNQGFSSKSNNPANASHYYSFTRLASAGELTLGGQTIPVSGESWYDREWSTSLLDKGQVGWDWFSLQLKDGSELMLFQLRNESGAKDYASGTLIRPDGSTQELKSGDIQLTPRKTWKSAKTGATYPIAWQVQIPKLDAEFTVTAAQSDQELPLAALAYWEGAVDVKGKLQGEAEEGVGYLELTGYAGSIQRNLGRGLARIDR